MSGGKLDVYLISDVHLGEGRKGNQQWQRGEEQNKEGGVFVLAGDIGNPYTEVYRNFLIEAKAACENVILVPGNHEYYNTKDMNVTKKHLKRITDELGIILLDNGEVVIGGIRFVGSTCWPLVPEEQFATLVREKYGLVTQVTQDSHKMDYSDYKKLHDSDVAFLENAVAVSKEPCVIITHYPPSSYFLNDDFEHSPHVALHYNRGLVEKVAKMNTLLWCCGHCHNSKRFWMKSLSTLVVANCVEGGEYDENFVISL